MIITDEFEAMLVAFGNYREKQNDEFYDAREDNVRTRVYKCDEDKRGYIVVFVDEYTSDMTVETIDNAELFGFLWNKLTTLTVS